MVDTKLYREAIVEYRRWLDKVRPAATKRFLDKLAADDARSVEGAVGEAVGWCWLASRCDVELLESESAGGVDFCCHSEAGSCYVEITSVTSDKISAHTGLDNQLNRGAMHYSTASRIIKPAVSRKAAQDQRQDLSYLVFVIGLHFEFMALLTSTRHLSELLVGSEVLRAALVNDANEPIGAVETIATLDHPLFFQAGSTAAARSNVSGVLIGGFGGTRESCRVQGLLNQNAVRPFDQAILPETCFGRLEPWPVVADSTVVWKRADGSNCSDSAVQDDLRREAERRLRQQGHGDLLDQIQQQIEQDN